MMAARNRSGRQPQKQKPYRERKGRDHADLGPVRFVCPVAGDKAAYRSYRVAERELLRIQTKPDVPGVEKPCRAYLCDDEGGCHFYHLTSLPEWDPEAGEDRRAADA